MMGPLGRGTEPILRIAYDGRADLGKVRLLPGTAVASTPQGVAIDFNGDHCGMLLPDRPAFRLTGSVSISCWVYLRSYVTSQNSAPGAQILFRGDDRSGCDPYHLTVNADGTISFTIEAGEGRGATVSAPISLMRWNHVVGSLDSTTGAMRLWIDGTVVAQSVTLMRPMADLDAGWTPGIGIGNVQAIGMHNQPLNGQVSDLCLWDRPVVPAEAGLSTIRFGANEG